MTVKNKDVKCKCKNIIKLFYDYYKVTLIELIILFFYLDSHLEIKP